MAETCTFNSFAEKGKICPYLPPPGSDLCIWHNPEVKKDTDSIRNELAQAFLNTGGDFEAFSLRKADLSGMNFPKANLRDADLRQANLDGIILSGADLRGAKLNRCSAVEAVFEGANFMAASLTDGNFTNANFKGTNLRVVFLGHANITGADFSDADKRNTDFSRAMRTAREDIMPSLQPSSPPPLPQAPVPPPIPHPEAPPSSGPGVAWPMLPAEVSTTPYDTPPSSVGSTLFSKEDFGALFDEETIIQQDIPVQPLEIVQPAPGTQRIEPVIEDSTLVTPEEINRLYQPFIVTPAQDQEQATIQPAFPPPQEAASYQQQPLQPGIAEATPQATAVGDRPLKKRSLILQIAVIAAFIIISISISAGITYLFIRGRLLQQQPPPRDTDLEQASSGKETAPAGEQTFSEETTAKEVPIQHGNDELIKTLKDLSIKLTQSENRQKELKKTLEGANRRITQMEKVPPGSEEEMNLLKHDISGKEKEISSLKKKIADREKVFAKNITLLTENVGEENTNKEELIKTKDEIESLRTQMAEKEKALSGNIASLTTKIKGAEKNIQKTKQEKEQLKKLVVKLVKTKERVVKVYEKKMAEYEETIFKLKKLQESVSNFTESNYNYFLIKWRTYTIVASPDDNYLVGVQFSKIGGNQIRTDIFILGKEGASYPTFEILAFNVEGEKLNTDLRVISHRAIEKGKIQSTKSEWEYGDDVPRYFTVDFVQ